MLEIGKVIMEGVEYPVLLSTYPSSGRVAVLIGTHHTRLSINVHEVHLAPGEFVLNHDVNNKRLNNNRKVLAVAKDCGLFEDTGRTVNYGYIHNQPVWRVVNFEQDE